MIAIGLRFVRASEDSRLRGGYRSGVPSIEIARTVARAELMARTREIAAACSEEVFSYFGWKPAAQIVSDVQREIFDRR